MSQFPPSQPSFMPLKPHRGGLILAFGLIGLLVCLPFAIAAWVMGNSDLRDIDAGIMDPAGRGMTEAGKIVGMVACILACLGFLVWILFFVVFAGIGIAGAARGGAP